MVLKYLPNTLIKKNFFFTSFYYIEFISSELIEIVDLVLCCTLLFLSWTKACWTAGSF